MIYHETTRLELEKSDNTVLNWNFDKISQKFLHANNFCTRKFLTRKNFYTWKFLHVKISTRENFYTWKFVFLRKVEETAESWCCQLLCFCCLWSVLYKVTTKYFPNKSWKELPRCFFRSPCLSYDDSSFVELISFLKAFLTPIFGKSTKNSRSKSNFERQKWKAKMVQLSQFLIFLFPGAGGGYSIDWNYLDGPIGKFCSILYLNFFK